MKSGTVGVTGATGYIGQFVMPALLGSGYRVRALTRSQDVSEQYPSAIEWVRGDLSSPSALAALTAGTGALIHLAYQHVPGRYRGGEGDDLAGWYAANLQGSLNLLLAARAAHVRRFVFLSSRAVFSQAVPGQRLDERHPVSPDTHYGAYKVAVEALVRSFAHQDGWKATSVRATGVYGVIEPVDRSKWWHLIRRAVRGDAVLECRGGTEIHGGDIARIVLALLDSDQPPPLVHASDLYVTTRQIVSLAHKSTGTHGPLPDAPAEPMRNQLVCSELANLNIKLGGQFLLEQTVALLAKAAQESARS